MDYKGSADSVAVARAIFTGPCPLPRLPSHLRVMSTVISAIWLEAIAIKNKEKGRRTSGLI